MMAPPVQESGVEAPTEIMPASPPARADALAALLGFGEPSPGSERAATVLATTFTFDRQNGADGTSDGGGTALPGAPAHPASKDLSLDAVFGAGDAAAPKRSSFSFDQFFSERATSESGGTAAAGGQESRDDVAKFTQWLEGLKQR
jgi:hypothetical protein